MDLLELAKTLTRKVISKKFMENRRIKVLKHYGGDPPRCACCEESIIEFLGIDHIKGKDKGDRSSGNDTYRKAIKENFPPDLQVLCHNCNMAKGFYGECPHEKMRRLDAQLREVQENMNAHRRSAN